nr:helicase associated domain-containing protein [Gordonia sp. UCD-TK1]
MTSRYDEGIAHLHRYRAVHGTSSPRQRDVIDGFPIGTWVATRRAEYRSGQMPPGHAHQLEAEFPDWQWTLRARAPFHVGLDHLHRYVATHGTSSPPRHATIDGFPIGAWAAKRRTEYRQHRLSPKRITQLEIEFPDWKWNVRSQHIAPATVQRRSVTNPVTGTVAAMAYATEQRRILVTACAPFRGLQAPSGYPDGLALCVIDSVQSTGVSYSSVENVVARYRSYRRAHGDDPDTDGVPELLATFDELGDPGGWAQKIGNNNRTSTRSGVLKSQAIRDAARVLDGARIASAEDLRETANDETQLAQIRDKWCVVTGQRSGITWHYLQMLAGIPGVKPDRMICRFVADSLGLARRSVTPQFAFEIVTAAAADIGMSPTDLDHAIWQYQRGRK